jgi:aspartate/methionine/tyrosine aminotransferase
MKEPWSKRHKRDFKGCKFSLSNSFAQPLSQPELLELTTNRGDTELLKLYNNHDLIYVPNGGSLDLKQDIATVVYDDELSAANILVFPGGQVAIQTAAIAFATGCHSIVFTPGYQSTIESPEWANNNDGITKIPRRPENNWQVDPERLREAIQENTKFVILNEPYNPGGIVMSQELQSEVIQICRQHDIVILCDEVYRLLEHEATGTRIPTIANAYESGISAVTMSKPWGGCGITIGWLACSNTKMIQRLVDVQYFGSACVSRASEIQARMVLGASDIILKDRISIIHKNKELLHDFIENRYCQWFSWQQPNAGAIAFVKFKGPWTSAELGQQLANAGISIKPAYCFTDEMTPDIESYFRVGFGERKMPLALEKLAEFVETHQQSWL